MEINTGMRFTILLGTFLLAVAYLSQAFKWIEIIKFISLFLVLSIMLGWVFTGQINPFKWEDW